MIQLRPSNWQKRLADCCAVLIGVAIALLWQAFAQSHSWYSIATLTAPMVLAFTMALAITVALTFIWMARRQNAKLGLEELHLILASAQQVWIGQKGVAPAFDAPLPELRKLQRYLGLIWLSNSADAQALIWPDSISADEHRQLRVWLGINAHRKSA